MRILTAIREHHGRASPTEPRATRAHAAPAGGSSVAHKRRRGGRPCSGAHSQQRQVAAQRGGSRCADRSSACGGRDARGGSGAHGSRAHAAARGSPRPAASTATHGPTSGSRGASGGAAAEGLVTRGGTRCAHGPHGHAQCPMAGGAVHGRRRCWHERVAGGGHRQGGSGCWEKVEKRGRIVRVLTSLHPVYVRLDKLLTIRSIERTRSSRCRVLSAAVAEWAKRMLLGRA